LGGAHERVKKRYKLAGGRSIPIGVSHKKGKNQGDSVSLKQKKVKSNLEDRRKVQHQVLHSDGRSENTGIAWLRREKMTEGGGNSSKVGGKKRGEAAKLD